MYLYDWLCEMTDYVRPSYTFLCAVATSTVHILCVDQDSIQDCVDVSW